MHRNIPLSIDDELLAEIDRVAESTKESRSAIMRRAIRDGLPVLAAGGKADVICMDGELSKDVDQVSAYSKLNRAKIILECIRTGVQPLYNKMMRDRIVRSQDHAPEEADTLLAIMEQTQQLDDPMQRELRTALRQRGAALVRLNDILSHVPEARRRKELIDRLTEFRQDPGGLRVGVWGAGLSTEEIAWQISMAEKYGVGAQLPDSEIKAREAAREVENQAPRQAQADAAAKAGVPSL